MSNMEADCYAKISDHRENTSLHFEHACSELWTMICEASAAELIPSEVSNVIHALQKNARWQSNLSAGNAAWALLDVASQSSTTEQPDDSLTWRSASLPDLPALAASASSSSPPAYAPYSAPSTSQEIGPASFARLRRALRTNPDLHNLDAHLLLYPFLQIVRSGDTSGPITAAALASVDKFISYQIIHTASPNLSYALQELSAAGTHCKFEASDSVSDEVVLLKILDVLKNTLTSPLGAMLTDEAVCEMMETGLSMCCQMRLSGASHHVFRNHIMTDALCRNASKISRKNDAVLSGCSFSASANFR